MLRIYLGKSNSNSLFRNDKVKMQDLLNRLRESTKFNLSELHKITYSDFKKIRLNKYQLVVGNNRADVSHSVMYDIQVATANLANDELIFNRQ